VDWLDTLRHLPPGRVFVSHEPETPRYGRARAKLAYVLRAGTFLGARPSEERPGRAMEIAVWAPPGHGRGPGYYCCFRIFLEEEVALASLMYGFWDGTEGSRGFRGPAAALAFARSQGFEGGDDGDPR